MSSKAGRVYDAIRSDIVSGRLPGGAVVDEASMATAYDVSRTPVREAIRRLSTDGLLTEGARRQASVVDLGERHREELVAVRAGLEGAAAPYACRLVRAEDLDDLELLVIKQRRSAETGAEEQFMELDEEFHRRLADIARFPTLSRFLEQLGAFVRLARAGVSTPAPHLQGLLREHEHLLELLRERDEAAFSAALDRHIRSLAPRG